MYQQFYVKKLEDNTFVVREDPGPGGEVTRTLATFQTEWAANEFCRVCTSFEHILRPKGFVTGFNALSYNGSIVANNRYTARSVLIGNVTLATMNDSGAFTDIYLERLFMLWVKIKYEKHIKPIFGKLWNGGW